MEVLSDASSSCCVLELETLFTQTLYTPQPKVMLRPLKCQPSYPINVSLNKPWLTHEG